MRLSTLPLFSIFALAACGGGEPPPALTPTPPVASAAPLASASAAPAAPPPDFRAKAPAPEGTITFVPPTIEEATLKNGMHVLFIERHELPIVSVELVSRRGAPEAKPGACSFMAEMLQKGTKKHDATRLAEEFEQIGTQVSSGCTNAATFVGSRALSPKLPRLLELLSEVARTPAFDGAEIERERKRRITQLDQMHDQPRTLARRALYPLLYPKGHPFSHDTLGEKADVQAITARDLAAARAATLTPSETTIVVAGDVERAALVSLLDSAFGDWKEAAPPRATLPALPPAEKGVNIVLIDRPGAPQSSLLAARIGVARDNPDFAKILVTNHIFGGSFSSRLNMNLREKHAYTYGAQSSFNMWWHGPGPFSMGAEVKTDATPDALLEMLVELQRMRDDVVSNEELAEAKSGLANSLPGEFTTTEAALSALAEIAEHSLPKDEFATRASRYAATTAADVQRLSKELLRADDLQIVIVGDAAKIESRLRDLKLGKIDVRHETAPAASAKGAMKPPAANPAATK